MGYQGEKKRIIEILRDPTFGYMRRSSMEYRLKDDALRINLVDGDLSNLVYVDPIGKNDSEDTSMRQKDGRMCRYLMRYTRGWTSFGDRRAKLSTLAIYNVAIQKDILEEQLRGIDITNGDREEIQHELDLVKNRRGSAINKSEIGPTKRPLITSMDWIHIQAREKIGWSEWHSVGRGKQWVL